MAATEVAVSEGKTKMAFSRLNYLPIYIRSMFCPLSKNVITEQIKPYVYNVPVLVVARCKSFITLVLNIGATNRSAVL